MLLTLFIACPISSVGTTIPDQLAPSHGVMVHGELNTTPSCETNTASGICLSGLMALKYAYLAIKSGEHQKAVTAGSETMSLILRAKRFANEATVSVG